jgi:hypothetical protein
MGVLGLFLSLAAPAIAQEVRPHLPTPTNTRRAPEIDPVAAGAVISVLVGGTAVIAARRSRRKSATK